MKTSKIIFITNMNINNFSFVSFLSFTVIYSSVFVVVGLFMVLLSFERFFAATRWASSTA